MAGNKEKKAMNIYVLIFFFFWLHTYHVLLTVLVIYFLSETILEKLG